MDRPALDAYLNRLQHGGPTPATLETATALLQAHLVAIPFETLDPYAGRDVALDEPSLMAKLVRGGRGGYCYEHNLLFGAALRALGFTVTDLAARVLWGAPPQVERGRTHMLLAVTIGGTPWLFDAGFGGQAVREPLRLEVSPDASDASAPAPASGGALRLQPAASAPGERRLQWHDGAGWCDLYRFDLQPQRLVDYELTSWYLGHHPASLFRTTLMAARCLPGGARRTLRGATYSEVGADGRRESTTVADPTALRALLVERFGLSLDGPAALPADQLDAALARAVRSAGAAS